MKKILLLLSLVYSSSIFASAVTLTVDSAEREKIIQGAKLLPYQVGGELKGYRVRSLKPNSLFEKIGLKEKDLIVGINDREMKDSIKDLYFMKTLIQSSDFVLKVVSEGEEKEHEIRVQFIVQENT